jgi:hypothetical protein
MLMTASMLGIAVALSTIGVIAHVDQRETTARLAQQREQNLEAIGISVAGTSVAPDQGRLRATMASMKAPAAVATAESSGAVERYASPSQRPDASGGPLRSGFIAFW